MLQNEEDVPKPECERKKNDESYFEVMTGRSFERQLCLENKGKCQFEVDNKMGWGEIMLTIFRSFLFKFLIPHIQS